MDLQRQICTVADMELGEIQKRWAVWHKANHEDITPMDQAKKVLEEAGEVIEATANLEATYEDRLRRGEDDMDEVSDEIVDVIIASMNLASLLSINIQEAVKDMMDRKGA